MYDNQDLRDQLNALRQAIANPPVFQLPNIRIGGDKQFEIGKIQPGSAVLGWIVKVQELDGGITYGRDVSVKNIRSRRAGDRDRSGIFLTPKIGQAFAEEILRINGIHGDQGVITGDWLCSLPLKFDAQNYDRRIYRADSETWYLQHRQMRNFRNEGVITLVDGAICMQAPQVR